jgi:putative MATE family efflux protein
MFVQRSIGNVKLPLIVSSIAFSLNTVLNYILIYGLFSMPKLGLDGSAVATLLARIIELALVLIIVYTTNNPIFGSLPEYFDLKSSFLKPFFKTTTPVIFNELVWSVGVSMYYVVYGRMGTEAIAAMSITSTFEKISFTLLMGVGNACAIIVGHKIGESNEDQAYHLGKKYLKAVLVSSIITGALLVLTSKSMISLFHVSPSVKDMAYKNIIIFSIFSIFKGINFTGICGILRSGGDTKYSFAVDTLCLWLVGVPLAFISGMIFHLPVYIVYLIVSFEEIIKMFFVLKRVESRKWINNLTEDKKAA